MLSKERAKEMYDKVVALGEKKSEHSHKFPGGVAIRTEMKTEVALPTVLVSLGIAITEDEAGWNFCSSR